MEKFYLIFLFEESYDQYTYQLANLSNFIVVSVEFSKFEFFFNLNEKLIFQVFLIALKISPCT